jgi:hypothetical protein
MHQRETHDPKQISILELELELAADEAVDDAFRDTLEMPIPEAIDDEVTSIHEITPSKLARWDGVAITYFVAV